MTGLILVPIVALIVAVPLARWARARRRDEKSIEAHRSTLGVIEHAAGADEQPGRVHDRSTAHVRVFGAPTSPLSRPAEEPEPWPARPRSQRPTFPRPKETALQPPPVPAPPSPPDQAARRPAVMNREIARLLASRVQRARSSASAAADGAPAEPPPLPPGSGPEPRPASRHKRRPRVALPATHHNLSVVVAAVAVALVMAAVTGIALSSHRGRPSHPPAAAVPPDHPAGTQPAPPPSSTTLAPPAVIATSADSTYAAYTVNASNLDVSLVAAGPCWVQLRNGTASGPIVFEGTLRSGVSQVFHAAGAIWLRLGDPGGVKLAIDGFPVALPAAANPFDVTVTGPPGA